MSRRPTQAILAQDRKQTRFKLVCSYFLAACDRNAARASWLPVARPKAAAAAAGGATTRERPRACFLSRRSIAAARAAASCSRLVFANPPCFDAPALAGPALAAPGLAAFALAPLPPCPFFFAACFS